MVNEILTAEIYLNPVNTADATREMDEQIREIEDKIRKYTTSLSLEDYAVSIASGLLAAGIDSIITGETLPFTSGKDLKSQIEDIFQKILFKYDPSVPFSRPKFKKPVAAAEFTESAVLQNLSRSGSPIGLIISVILQLGKGGLLNLSLPRNIRLFPVGSKHEENPFAGFTKDEMAVLGLSAVIVGILKWLVTTSDDDAPDIPTEKNRTLRNLRELIRTVPSFKRTVAQIEKWQCQLPNEIRVNKKNKPAGSSLEQIFCSFFLMLATSPGFQGTRLQDAVQKIRAARRIGLDQIPLIQAFSRQAFPVLVNEILVRTFFFAGRLLQEMKTVEGPDDVRWENVLPFGNRDIDRMMTIASVTLSTADMVDAAGHAAMDCAGNWVLFATRFVTKMNFVAAGRAAVLVFREMTESNERKALEETRLLCEKSKTAKVVEILENYRRELDARLSAYLSERIESFLTGVDLMDRGLAAGDSDMVIQGNVVIQRVLGREPQFTNQREFDDLMDSDITLTL